MTEIQKDPLIGQRFGKLVVTDIYGKTRSRENIYILRCDCGNMVIRRKFDIVHDPNPCPNCGCIKAEKARTDIIGKMFGHLEVIEFDHDEKCKPNNKLFFKCLCHNCGNYKVVEKRYLLDGTTTHCGCDKKPRPANIEDEITPVYEKDFEGKDFNPFDLVHDHARFGRLVVTGLRGKRKGAYYYDCVCDCGNTRLVRRDSLVKGATVSCGCYNVERVKETHINHGMYNTRFYKIYIGMKQRCYNPNNTWYEKYGGRGITICDRWMDEEHGFENFKDDMYDKYLEASNKYGEENISINRIDNDGNYFPENCEWVTMKDQNFNTSRNKYVEYDGETYAAKELLEESGVDLNYKTFMERLDSGWDVTKALTTPAKEQTQHIYTYNGETLPLSEIVKKYADCRLDYSIVIHRIYDGWDLERALHEIPKIHNGKPVIQPISFRKVDNIIPNFSNNNYIEL